MSSQPPEGFGPLAPAILEQRLRQLAERRGGSGVVDDLELRHLVSVILHGAVLLHDLYASDRVGSLYTGDPRSIARGLIAPLLSESENPQTDVLARIGRLPEEVRLLGDKCLFDVGITRIRQYRGLDLHDLGVRAYGMASEILGILSEDGNLREFFDRNRLAPLPLAEEVTFLKQCAKRFGIHADLLLHLQLGAPLPADSTSGMVAPHIPNDLATGAAMPAQRRPHPTSMPGPPAEGDERALPGGGSEPSLHGEASGSAPLPTQLEGPPDASAQAFSDLDSMHLTREDLLSSYERIVLFSALDVNRLSERLNAVVVDQPEAVDALCDEFALYATGTHSLTKPPSYFFVGPTGVGKNYLVETLVQLLGETAGVEIPLLTIDGPNYTDPSDINELRGSTRGFIRSDEEGVLAEFHERSSHAPLSVILVDEVEKAHPHLRKFFLSLMDRGTVTDNRGRSLFFANSMVVFTSNLGFSESASHAVPIGYRGDESRAIFEQSEVDRSLRQALSAEFVNRLRIIRFSHLTRSSIEKIFDLEFDRVRRRFRDVHGLELDLTAEAREQILSRGYSYDYGARHLGGVINSVANVDRKSTRL